MDGAGRVRAVRRPLALKVGDKNEAFTAGRRVESQSGESGVVNTK